MLKFRGSGVRFGTKGLKFGINLDEMGTKAEGPPPAIHAAGKERLEDASAPAVPFTLCHIDDCIGRACNGRATGIRVFAGSREEDGWWDSVFRS